MRDALEVPTFHRLDEYAGVWLLEPHRFAGLWSGLGRIDWAAHLAAAQPARTTAATLEPGKNKKSVAVIRVGGLLMKQQSSLGGTSTVQLRRDVRQAAANPDVSGILLAIDSPGGSAAGTADFAADVKAAARQKPVWAHVEDLGASAAYWVASQADQVFASNNTTQVGSIGTFQTIYDLSGAAEKEGVKVLHFATGPLKGAGAPGTAVSDEQREYFQGLVDAIQENFDAAVRSGRGMSAAQLAAVRSGAVFPAKAALELKLIDGIQSFDRTLAALASAK